MDEPMAPVQEQTSSIATADRNPELSLRLRQRDRLSPRGRFGKTGRITTSVREVDESPKNGIALAPAPRSKAQSPDFVRKKQVQEGLRKEASVHRRAKREAEDLKYGIVPDGISAGREGRQFTVANVGNNGRIYLRPTIRPPTQRYPQPSFVFPITPPSTAGLDALVSRQEADHLERDSIWTPSRSPVTPVKHTTDDHLEQSRRASQAGRPRRAFSQSTIDENHVQTSVRDSDIGAFRVVIERPGNEPRQEEPFTGTPILEIPIPSYKLGTPRFSTRGTAFLRGSSYTATDDMRSSILSSVDRSKRNTGTDRRTRILSRRHSDASPQILHSGESPLSLFDFGSTRSPRIIRQCTRIVPDMFDDLTFKPACDHPSVVRYSVGGGIRAATPARLVAEITSPTFVDYDLLSDFFLTFRSFLDTSDLLNMLIARLKWAILRTDETGIVVRVRTFVAVRHWILNYFLDDYVVDYELRKAFCDLLNKFVEELSNNPAHTKAPRKILWELKKCWRRVCALYWDSPEFNTELGSDIPISPGGVAGSRDPNLDPSFWAKDHVNPPRLDDIIEPDFLPAETSVIEKQNYFADVSRAGHLESVIGFPEAVSAYQVEKQEEDQPPLSPTSIMSDDFVSCSFPSRGRVTGNSQPLGAHPVPASSIYDQAPPIAMTPRALTGKRVRPAHAHKRSASFSDSLRDQRVQQQQQQPVQKVLYKSTELLLALPYAGSLVRGNLFPPAQGFVEIVAPSTPAEADRPATSLPGMRANQKGPSAMSGPGMKKLLGSVRRALSTKNGSYPNSSPTQGSFPHIPPLGVRGVTINRLPGTAVVPQAPPRNTGARAPMRIDLLGAEVAEDFKRAVQEDADSERYEQEETERRSTASSMHDPNLHYSVLRPDSTFEFDNSARRRAPLSEVTNGSKSIMIMDDTNLPVMTGALPVNPSVDTFAEVFNQPSGGPTPPSTPPEATLGTPRRSSHLLGEHTRSRSRSLSFEETPSLVVDSRPSGEDERLPFQRPFGRPSLRSRAQSHSHKRSMSLRKYASYQSGFTRHRSERSFDATTFSGTEEVERLSQVASIPLPLRVLRRRPGGDLRAVTNVGDLNTHQLRRPMSTGSFATYTDSVRSSFLFGSRHSGEYVDVVSSSYDQSRSNENAFSLGALAEASPKPAASLTSRRSSQPVMRPSFEKEAKYLAQIPDDVDDDGGVESALLKLEGKFEQRRSDATGEAYIKNDPGTHNSFGAADLDMSSFAFNHGENENRQRRQTYVLDSSNSKRRPVGQVSHTTTAEELQPTVYQPHGTEETQRPMSPHSMDSYNSVPLLDRGLTDDGEGQKDTSDWSQHSILCGPSNERLNTQFETTPNSSHPNSYDFINETESMKSNLRGQKPNHDSVTQSFLDLGSDSDDRSDLSSELSLEVISRTEYTEVDASSTQTFPPIRAGTVIKEMPLPSRSPRPPPSPSLTLVQALMLSPKPIDTDPGGQQMHKPFPPTPQISPTAANAITFNGDRGTSPSVNPLRSHIIPEASRKTSIHLPFTLAFDSQVLAQQFTLIEKDALNEIDWKDLIEMPWKDSSTESRSWVDFLRTSEPRGVEVVIARFNLVVKWAVSEIVLTQDLGERVRCIIKYIHIAAHCRKYRNFATLTQLTVALTSNDITRLTNTWASVPATDIRTLRELETLVTPMGNFYNLRAEMEGSGAGQGCIPFVGIYTHDLLVNSERPSQFASTPTTEPLVNFERCRTDAGIVKNLLRLLEASQLYRFLPIEGITERCLWMAALSDEEISRYGRLIQE